jgi:hypothetical protein
MKLGTKYLRKIFYAECSFRFDPLTNMAATGNSCFRLVVLLVKDIDIVKLLLVKDIDIVKLLLVKDIDNVKLLLVLEAQWDEPVLLIFHSALRKLNTEPSIVLSTKFRFILAKQFQRRRFFRNRPI